MSDSAAVGARVREARKRRGLTQHDLASTSGLSISLITKLESGAHGGMRLETVHKLAIALRVSTSALMSEPDAAEPERDSVTDWEPVRRALRGDHDSEPDEEPTAGGVRDGLSDAVDAVQATRYAELHATLPMLLRDADAIVSAATGGAELRARQARSEIRQLTAYMMAQTWQFDTAFEAIELALGDASDDLIAMAAADWKSWVLLRQGRLAESAEIAAHWADAAEPKKLSKASPDELIAWGRFLTRASTVATRDNRLDDARDALRLARAAAAAIGRNTIPSVSPWSPFGPAVVVMIHAENAIIQGRPDVTLADGSQIAKRGNPSYASTTAHARHRLDVARAYAITHHYAEAVGVLQEVRAARPEWLAQQRYARDTLTTVLTHRRALTDEMRDLADLCNLPL